MHPCRPRMDQSTLPHYWWAQRPQHVNSGDPIQTLSRPSPLRSVFLWPWDHRCISVRRQQPGPAVILWQINMNAQDREHYLTRACQAEHPGMNLSSLISAAHEESHENIRSKQGLVSLCPLWSVPTHETNMHDRLRVAVHWSLGWGVESITD